jgi:lanthanide-dependent methanol dehydrogenase
MRPTLSAALAVFVTLMSAPAARANDDLNQLSKDPKQWVMQLGNYAGHRYSALDQINEGNVAKLQVAWMFSTGVLRGHAGGPLVIGNMMYLVTPFPNNVIALDLDKDQQIVWTYRPKQDPATVPVMCCDTVNRGLAYADETIYFQQSDTSVVALDAQTGKEKWKIINGDPKRGETATAAPLVVQDKVIVGISGGEFGGDCHLTAFYQGYWQAGLARLCCGPRRTNPHRPGQDNRSWQACGQGGVARVLEGRGLATRRCLRLGLAHL